MNFKLKISALKICWSSLRLFILYQSQRSVPTFQWKVKTICTKSNISSLLHWNSHYIPFRGEILWKYKKKCTFSSWICVEKYFLWSKYIFLVWKAFIIISHSALPQSFCDNKFSAFWRQFHNRKGKLEGSWYIIYSFGTFPPSYRKRCSNNTYYVDFTWWLDMESFLSNLSFLVTIFTMRLRYF